MSKYTIDDMMLDIQMRVPLSDIKQKIRAEAIEEFVEKADSAIYEDFNKSDVGEYTIADVALTIRQVAEQLKEDK